MGRERRARGQANFRVNDVRIGGCLGELLWMVEGRQKNEGSSRLFSFLNAGSAQRKEKNYCKDSTRHGQIVLRLIATLANLFISASIAPVPVPAPRFPRRRQGVLAECPGPCDLEGLVQWGSLAGVDSRPLQLLSHCKH